MPKINTNSFAKKTTLNELKKRGFDIKKISRDFLVNQKIINVRGCNSDNRWARKDRAIGWNRINPEKFDYLVCVSFNSNFKNVRYFIF